jgi:hypothetical protein
LRCLRVLLQERSEARTSDSYDQVQMRLMRREEQLTYHVLLAGIQALLAEDDAGALTIAAAPTFISWHR